MALDTTIPVSALTYNGTPMTLSGIIPSGKITITANGTDIDVSQYATADVNVSGGDTPLPSGYTRLAYIQSTGTQKLVLPIDFGSRTTRCSFDMQVTERLSSLDIFFDVSNEGEKAACWAGVDENTKLTLGSTATLSTASPLTRNTVDIDFFYTIQSSYPNRHIAISVGSERKERTSSSASTTIGNATVFASTMLSSACAMKLYGLTVSAQIVTGVYTVAADYVPVLRKADNVIGLYDLLTGGFYTNSGSGSFVGGEL